LQRRNYGDGFPSFTVLQPIDETLEVLRQSSDANDSVVTSSRISAQLYEIKRRALLVTALSSLILCVFLPTSLQAVGGAAPKTDTELAQALIGTWELLLSEPGFSKRFIMFNPDGTSKAIRITNDRGSRRRTESEGRWRINHGQLIRDIMKMTPPNHDVLTPINVRAQIESTENGKVELRYQKGDQDEMHRVNHLPALPPLLTDTKPVAIYAPPPEYPLTARNRRWTGSGLFACNLRPDGTVASVVVLQSTDHDMLDQAGISALRRWKFKPAGSEVVRVPLKFTMGEVRHRMSGAVISD
jgi:TonB family protein